MISISDAKHMFVYFLQSFRKRSGKFRCDVKPVRREACYVVLTFLFFCFDILQKTITLEQRPPTAR